MNKVIYGSLIIAMIGCGAASQNSTSVNSSPVASATPSASAVSVAGSAKPVTSASVSATPIASSPTAKPAVSAAPATSTTVSVKLMPCGCSMPCNCAAPATKSKR